MAQTEDSVSQAHDVDNAGAYPRICVTFKSGRGASWEAFPRVGTISVRAGICTRSLLCSASQMAQTADSVSRAHDVDNAGAWPCICATFESGRGGSWAALPRWGAHRYTQVLLEASDDDRSHALRGNVAQDPPRPLLNVAQIARPSSSVIHVMRSAH